MIIPFLVQGKRTLRRDPCDLIMLDAFDLGEPAKAREWLEKHLRFQWALHPDEFKVAQSGGALVRRNDELGWATG